MIIIIDRRKKRANFDNQWADPFSLDLIKREKANTLEIDKDSDNIVDRFIMNWGVHVLMGMKVWAVKSDGSRHYSGHVVDVYPSRHLLIKVGKNNMPMEFDSVISIGEK